MNPELEELAEKSLANLKEIYWNMMPLTHNDKFYDLKAITKERKTRLFYALANYQCDRRNEEFVATLYMQTDRANVWLLALEWNSTTVEKGAKE